MLKANFYNNFNIIADALKTIDDENPNLLMDEIRALNEMFFYVNNLEIENRELKLQRSKLQERLNKFLKEQI